MMLLSNPEIFESRIDPCEPIASLSVVSIATWLVGSVSNIDRLIVAVDRRP
jgi:hypothetical protein